MPELPLASQDPGLLEEQLDELLGGTGLLAALLIIKQVGRDALRNTLELTTGRDQPLPESFFPPPQSFFTALTETTAEHATDAATRYVANVAPLVVSAASEPYFQGALIAARMSEIRTPEGRTATLSLLAEMVDAAGRFAGRFTTPAPVADLMLELASPRPGETFYDPCFGFGGFLIGAAHRMDVTAGTDPSPARTDRIRIVGVEVDREAYAVGLCRTLLAGIRHPRLALGDALHRPRPAGRFDCILAAPPWGRASSTSRPANPADTGTDHTADHGLCSARPQVRSRDYENLFLQHVMESLRPGGRAVVALPERTLFRAGADQRVREALLSGYRVDAVIALPAAAFASSMNVPVNLVVFTRDEPVSTVRFVRISPGAWETVPGARDGGHMRGELQRWLAGVIHTGEAAATAVPGGVDAWETPVRELARRDHDLVARKTGSEALKTELQRIAAADRSVQVARLEHVADVRAGVSYKRQTTTSVRAAPAVMAGLLRVGDVNATTIRAPSLFLIGDGNRPVNERDILRPGDVVVTASGTVGKIGVIPDVAGVAGSVATRSLAVIRVREDVRPRFLAALLRSPAYQNWLAGHARGTTIQHLLIRTLRDLPIPVPRAAVQDAVLDELGGAQGDALAVLGRRLAARERSALAVWLETSLVSRVAAGWVSDDSDQMENLAAATDALVSLTSPVERGTELATHMGGDPGTDAWFHAAGRAGMALDGVASIRHGAGRLAVLELGRSRLYEALHALDRADDPTVNRLRSFTRAMTEMAESAIRAMQESIAIGVDAQPAEVVAGIDTEVHLRLTNSSDVPLRNVQVEARLEARGTAELDAIRPPLAHDRIAYLSDGDTCDLPVTVSPKDATRPLCIVVSWQVQRLDGTPASGEKWIDLQVRSSGAVEPAGDLGASPYIVGSPVDRPEMFFGRADVMARIRRQLGARAHANVILLEGNRRTGKTSILRQLEKADAPPGWIPVYCSLQAAEGDATRSGIPTRNVFRLLAWRTARVLHKVGVETWFPDLPGRDTGRPFELAFRAALNRAFAGEHPFETFKLYVDAAIGTASPRRILLMLDEFDKLQEGIDAGITSPQVPENIRHLLQHQPGLSAIITGSRRLKRLREEYWSALFGLGHRVGISALPIDAARRLATEPVEGRLDYLPQARDRVVELCARQPFLVQSLCNRVFDQAAAGGRRTITADVVAEAAAEMVRDNEHFRTLWDYAGTERRRLLLMLCDRLSEGPDAVNLDLLQVKLHELEVPVSRIRDLTTDIAELRELELIELDNSHRGGMYRLSVPLMKSWLQVNVDFNEAVVRARDEAIEAQP